MKKQQSETGAVGWLAIYSTFRFVPFHNLNEKSIRKWGNGMLERVSERIGWRMVL